VPPAGETRRAGATGVRALGRRRARVFPAA